MRLIVAVALRRERWCSLKFKMLLISSMPGSADLESERLVVEKIQKQWA